MYSSINLNTASSLSAASDVYSHFMLFYLCVSIPINRHATCYCDPPRTRPMWGVTTQVSAQKSSANWTTALQKKTDTCGASPSLLRILVNLCHTSHALTSWRTYWLGGNKGKV